MFQVLNAYLFQHKSISIPGLGTIYLDTHPAHVDVADRIILPPKYQYRFDKYFDAPDREFFIYIATHRGILDYEAIKWYNEVSFDLRNRIKNEDQVAWDGVGVFKKDGTGNVLFESEAETGVFLGPAPAHRVNRQDAQHVLLVGDQERTNVEMNEWLAEEERARRRRPWWVIALIIGVVAVSLIAWHFYINGWVFGNQTRF
jgi:hypothetical protein